MTIDKDREIARLQKELADCKKRLDKLKQSNAAWRRMAQEQGPRRECIREGYRNGVHYKIYVVADLPGDLPLEDAMVELRETFLPKMYPYQFAGMDWSNRYTGWLVTVERTMPTPVTMTVYESELGK